MTLVEIMVVITIMGLIMGAVAVVVTDRLRDAKVKTAVMDIKTLENNLDLYFAQQGTYPEVEVGLKALVTANINKELPNDPWGAPYVYTLDASRRPIVASYGEDNAPGGEGFAADLSSKTVR